MRKVTIGMLLASLCFGVAQAAEEMSVQFCVVEPPTGAAGYPFPLGARPRADVGVLLGYTVTKEGTVRDLTVVWTDPKDFPTWHAVKYASRLRFDPRIVDGEAVEVPGVQEIMRYRARLVEESGGESIAGDASSCFRVPYDPYWRDVLNIGGEIPVPFQHLHAATPPFDLGRIWAVVLTIESKSELSAFLDGKINAVQYSELSQIDFDRQILLVLLENVGGHYEPSIIATRHEELAIVLTYTELNQWCLPADADLTVGNQAGAARAVYLAIDRPEVWPVPVEHRIEKIIGDCD